MSATAVSLDRSKVLLSNGWTVSANTPGGFLMVFSLVYPLTIKYLAAPDQGGEMDCVDGQCTKGVKEQVEKVWQGAVASNMVVGLISCAGAFAGPWIVRNVPLPALLTPTMGVGFCVEGRAHGPGHRGQARRGPREDHLQGVGRVELGQGLFVWLRRGPAGGQGHVHGPRHLGLEMGASCTYSSHVKSHAAHSPASTFASA